MMEASDDIYRTIPNAAKTVVREKGSRFLAYAFPVKSEQEIKDKLEPLKKKYYDATHHCYAWRLGAEGLRTRANDDGEPSGTAGKPILGQILSLDLTDVLVVVVRYFGGTKLGVSGLINTYREAARQVLDDAGTMGKMVQVIFVVRFSYLSMNGVMKIVKDFEPQIISQSFDNLCEMTMSVRASSAQAFEAKLLGVEGVEAEKTEM